MTATPNETDTIGSPEGESAPIAPDTENAPRPPGRPWALPLFPAALTLAITVIGIGTPSLWLDEAATISMTTRSYGDMLRVFHNMDLVHALYYVLMKPWVTVFGTGEIALRLPSALAMTAAAAGITVIVRSRLGTSAGLLAGLAWAVGLQTTRWAHEGRSYAMTAAVAVLATYLFLRAVDGDERRPWRWFAGYVPAIMLLGFLHLHGSLLVAAHGVTLLLTRPGARRLVCWLLSAGVAIAPLVPFALIARDQKDQVRWLPEPSWEVAWTQLQFFAGGRPLVAPVVTLAVIGVAAGIRAHRTRTAGSRPGVSPSLPAVALPWLVVPTALLVAVSLVSDPVFYFRYTTYCLPAIALLVGAGLARVLAAARRRADQAAVMAVAVVALVAPSLQDHVYFRKQESRPEDMRKAADVVSAHARPGDAIVYLAGIVRWSAATYPDVFGRLRDVDMRVDPVTAANLGGRDVFPRNLAPRLAHTNRVWVMNHRSLEPHGPVIERRERAVQAAGPWRRVGTWNYMGGWLVLFERTGPYRSSK
ncbi:glycosyltransferase family 39 protein [Spirillospora sp. NPDC048819]|uniref:glycosyltransferase family 39 protein n=1 Tax=Spirillospora sp. NPDC048819 TaxID=3155268 RepID=UPI00340FDB84